jgi:hypothetical protein
VCGQANEHCPLFPGKTKVVHVGFDDPPALTNHLPDGEAKLAVYRRVRDEIRRFVETLPGRLEIEGETGCLSHHGERFTRRITTGATVLIFDTGWTKHGPKPDFPAYAYVMISHDGRQMSLYHEWGGGDFCCCCMPVVAVDALARWVFSDLLRIK